MLKKLLIALGGLALAFVVVGFLLPETTAVERRAVVPAPQATVFTVLNGYRNFNRWSPWADLDPDAQYTYEGPVQGVGAKMTWSGKPEVGSGSQEITASEPWSRVSVKLVFEGWEDKPARAEYRLREVPGGTEVAWRFEARHGANLLDRWFGLLMDGFIGADYEKGLARLAEFAGTLPDADFSDLDIQAEAAEPLAVAAVVLHSADEPRAIGVSLGVAYGQVAGALEQAGLPQAGPPLARYSDAGNGTVRIEAGIPVPDGSTLPDGEVRVLAMGGTPVIRVHHRGPYDGLPATRAAAEAYLAAAGITARGTRVEHYVDDPADTPAESLTTRIDFPVD